MGNGKRTKIDPEKVRELAAQGMSDRELALLFGSSISAVSLVRRKHSIQSGTKRASRLAVYDVERIRSLAASGLTDLEIRDAIEAKCSTCVIFKIRRRHGIVSSVDKIKRYRKAAESHRKTKAKNRKYSLDSIRALKADGKTDAEVGILLGLAETSVYRIRKRHGIENSWSSVDFRRKHAEKIRKSLPKTQATLKSQRELLASQCGLPSWIRTSHLKVLLALMGGPLRMKDLVRAVGRRSGNSLGAIDGVPNQQSLLESGLIERSSGRPLMLSITPLALAMIAVSQPETHHAEET